MGLHNLRTLLRHGPVKRHPIGPALFLVELVMPTTGEPYESFVEPLARMAQIWTIPQAASLAPQGFRPAQN